MRENLYVKLVEQHIKKHCSETLDNSPVNCMTPFLFEREDGIEEYMFVVKAESWLYNPLEGRTIDDRLHIGVKAYQEDNNLIFGFDVEPDINLETVIYEDKIRDFLIKLKKQERLTITMIDYITYNIVWIANDYPFYKVVDQFQPLFDYYRVE